MLIRGTIPDPPAIKTSGPGIVVSQIKCPPRGPLISTLSPTASAKDTETLHHFLKFAHRIRLWWNLLLGVGNRITALCLVAGLGSQSDIAMLPRFVSGPLWYIKRQRFYILCYHFDETNVPMSQEGHSDYSIV